MNGCTCGPYLSVIPPEPCPIHDPERAYWRAKYLAEFGGHTATTTNTADCNGYGNRAYMKTGGKW